MKKIVKPLWLGALLAMTLSGCGSLHTVRAATKTSGLFCPSANTALAGLRDTRVAFSSGKTVCAADRLKLAMQLVVNSDNKTDLARARTLVESVQNGTEVQHDPALAGLAMLMERVLADRRRADERIDKMTVQARDQQQRVDDLTAKLQALTAVERSMAQKASKKRAAL